MLNTVHTFHQYWFYVAIATTGAVGLWGLALALMKRTPPKAFEWARGVAFGVILAQVAAGVYMYSNDVKPGDPFHVFYGVVIVVTLTLAYVYRATMARKPALTYGVLLLFVMGLGLRAWANVS
jgi:CDP-diglyceride synthetase